MLVYCAAVMHGAFHCLCFTDDTRYYASCITGQYKGLLMSHLFSTFPILALFLLGFLLKRARFFKADTIAEIKKFVTTITLPALLFNAFLSLEIQLKDTLMIAVIYLMCVLMIFIGKGVAKIAKVRSPYFPLLMGGFEMGMFGYALFISLYGEEHLGKMAFLVIGQSFFVFTVLFSAITAVQDGKQSMRSNLKNFLSSPIILAMITGIIVGQVSPNLGQGPTAAAFLVFIRLLGSITVPLITITIGYGIAIGRKGLGLSLFTILIRKSFLVVFALLINRYIINGFLHMDKMYSYAMVILALSPPTFIFSVLADPDDTENYEYINRTISLDCLVSIFLTMIAASIL